MTWAYWLDRVDWKKNNGTGKAKIHRGNGNKATGLPAAPGDSIALRTLDGNIGDRQKAHKDKKDNVLQKLDQDMMDYWAHGPVQEDKDIKVEILLDLNNLLDLLLDELLVLLSSDLTLGELVALDTDFLGLGE